MTTKEAIEELRTRGVSITPWTLRGMLERGEVERPRLNSALHFDWTMADIIRVERAMVARVSRAAAKA